LLFADICHLPVIGAQRERQRRGIGVHEHGWRKAQARFSRPLAARRNRGCWARGWALHWRQNCHGQENHPCSGKLLPLSRPLDCLSGKAELALPQHREAQRSGVKCKRWLGSIDLMSTWCCERSAIVVHIHHRINRPKRYIKHETYTCIEYCRLYKFTLLSESCIALCKLSTPFRVKNQTQSKICSKHNQNN